MVLLSLKIETGPYCENFVILRKSSDYRCHATPYTCEKSLNKYVYVIPRKTLPLSDIFLYNLYFS